MLACFDGMFRVHVFFDHHPSTPQTPPAGFFPERVVAEPKNGGNSSMRDFEHATVSSRATYEPLAFDRGCISTTFSLCNSCCDCAEPVHRRCNNATVSTATRPRPVSRFSFSWPLSESAYST